MAFIPHRIEIDECPDVLCERRRRNKGVASVHDRFFGAIKHYSVSSFDYRYIVALQKTIELRNGRIEDENSLINSNEIPTAMALSSH
jgi:hypothetical protein